jgi:hypothetical protein
MSESEEVEVEYTEQQLRIKNIELPLTHPVPLSRKWRTLLVKKLIEYTEGER